MSHGNFEDDCKGCKPVLIDLQTRKPMAEDTPEMQAVLKVWAETTLAERQAFHRMTCLNSRAPEDLAVAAMLTERIQKILLDRN